MNYPDIYFHPDYAHVHEIIENGRAFQFIHRSGLGLVSHTFIKRDIGTIGDGKTVYCDIISPYGYGGPIVLECQDKNHKKLLDEFMFNFALYCKDNCVVSEFIRFHPIESNHADLDGYYDISPIRKTLATNLIDFGDPFVSEFSKRCRNTIVKCTSLGMKFSINSDKESLDSFLNIYNSTMQRNRALDYYYHFNATYFEVLLRLFPRNSFIATVYYKDKPIAAGFYMHYGKYVHAHLSGTLEEYLRLSPAYLLKAEVVRWAKEQGYSFVHHGGGYSNSPTDGIFKFKKAFSQHTEFDFFVGKRVWNEKAYQLLSVSNQHSDNIQTEYFPAYRKRF